MTRSGAPTQIGTNRTEPNGNEPTVDSMHHRNARDRWQRRRRTKRIRPRKLDRGLLNREQMNTRMLLPQSNQHLVIHARGWHAFEQTKIRTLLHKFHESHFDTACEFDLHWKTRHNPFLLCPSPATRLGVHGIQSVITRWSQQARDGSISAKIRRDYGGAGGRLKA